jgi:hypothetical protein
MKNIFPVLAILGLLSVIGYSLLSNPSSIRGAATGAPITSKRILQVTTIKNFDAKGARFTQLGTAGGIEDLMVALETYGARLEMTEVEENGLSSLRIKVDGIQLSPVITACKNCEPIVFEY